MGSVLWKSFFDSNCMMFTSSHVAPGLVTVLVDMMKVMMRMSLTSRGHICSPIILLHPSVSRFALSRPWLCFCQMVLHTWAHTRSPRSAGVRRSAVGDEAPGGDVTGDERCDERLRETRRSWVDDFTPEHAAVISRLAHVSHSNRLFAFQCFIWSSDFGFIYNEITKSHPQILRMNLIIAC